MTQRRELIQYVAWKLLTAARQYRANNGTMDGFKSILHIAEIISDAQSRNLAVGRGVESYHWPRLVAAILKECEGHLLV